MPIYAYKCSSCGHAKDVLQKISADPLTVCPVCGSATFTKQLTAPGFQLKGSGWYVTDFRDGKKSGGDAKADETKSDGKTDDKPETKTETKTDTKTDTKSQNEAAPATPVTPVAAPTPASTPAPASTPPAK